MKTLLMLILSMFFVTAQAQVVPELPDFPEQTSFLVYNTDSDEWQYKTAGEGLFINASAVDGFNGNYFNLANIPDMPTWSSLEKPYWISGASEYMQSLMPLVESAAEFRDAVISHQSHINDATNNAPDTLSGLTLAEAIDEINAANARYNDLAAKFNALLDAQESNGVLAP